MRCALRRTRTALPCLTRLVAAIGSYVQSSRPRRPAFTRRKKLQLLFAMLYDCQEASQSTMTTTKSTIMTATTTLVLPTVRQG